MMFKHVSFFERGGAEKFLPEKRGLQKFVPEKGGVFENFQRPPPHNFHRGEHLNTERQLTAFYYLNERLPFLSTFIYLVILKFHVIVTAATPYLDQIWSWNFLQNFFHIDIIICKYISKVFK